MVCLKVHPGKGKYVDYRRISRYRIGPKFKPRTYYVHEESRDVHSVGKVRLFFSTTKAPAQGHRVEVQKTLMTNDAKLTLRDVIELYQLRWQIELFFKELEIYTWFASLPLQGVREGGNLGHALPGDVRLFGVDSSAQIETESAEEEREGVVANSANLRIGPGRASGSRTARTEATGGEDGDTHRAKSACQAAPAVTSQGVPRGDLIGGSQKAQLQNKFDLLITDEAHNCAPSDRGKYATDSLRTKALRLLAPHFEHKLFLTATPHNGYPESFSALLELLDNQRFARSTKPDRKQLDAVMVRRMKSELPTRWDGSPRFPKRTLEPLEVPYTDEEKAIHAALKQYAGLRSKRARDNAESIATDFVLKTLKKRLFSSPAAFLTTLNKHEASLRQAVKKTGGTKPTFGTLKRDIDRIDEDYADDKEYDEATGDAVETASRLFSEPSDQELALVKRMRDWAERTCSQNDSKARQLIAWLKDHIRPNGQWTDERVILFTEYRATQKWLSEVLSSEGFTGQDRLMTMYGGMDAKSREAIKAAFQAAPDQSPVRILLATDAASEGLDLQNHCSKLIHYEIPWNPNRMEQRNGRIDRHGQKADYVRVFHFVSKGYKQRQSSTFTLPMSELDADLEFLMRVAQKVETIREDLGSVGQVLADDVEAAMLERGYNLARTDNADLCA